MSSFSAGIAQSGDDQQKTVGVVGAGFPDLPGVENKIFAQDGLRDFFAGVAHDFLACRRRIRAR